MNMDNYPEQIVVTFKDYQASKKAIQKRMYKPSGLKSAILGGQEVALEASAVTCTIPVRNCKNSNDSPAQKYLPVYADAERANKYRVEKLNQKKD
jgi:hypothetical protein